MPSHHKTSGHPSPLPFSKERDALAQEVEGLQEEYRTLTCVCVCVCVSHPGSKGFPRSHLSTTTEAGSIFPLMQGATESLHGCRQRSSMQLTRISRLITVTYLQPKPLTTLSNLLGLFPFPPPKPFPPQQRCSLSRFVTAVKGNNHCSNTYNFSDFSPYCSTAFLPNVAIESN